MNAERFLAGASTAVEEANPVRRLGRVARVVGLTVEAAGPAAWVGELCSVSTRFGGRCLAEVAGFREGRTILLPYGELAGVEPGCHVRALGHGLRLGLGWGMLGRVLDGLGRPRDGEPLWRVEEWREVEARGPDPLARPRIREPLQVGVRAVDGLLTVGRGQRVGIFAGSGVGKSTFLGMMARGTAADVTVIALVGERSREVLDFLEEELGEEARRRSVAVVATAEEPALVRLKAAFVATAVAEFFRDRGADVLLLMDSLTRFAMAQREAGLAAGEPPTTKGYPPSVFALLPRLLERAGTGERGTITGFYTVLVDGDDLTDPVADAARSILDGHVVLARELAQRGLYPAVDVLQSVSRVMDDVVDREHLAAAHRFRRLLATYRAAEDLIDIGAYREGANPDIDEARARYPALADFLRQEPQEAWPFGETRERLLAAVGGC